MAPMPLNASAPSRRGGLNSRGKVRFIKRSPMIRKILTKFGFEKMPGIYRVTMRTVDNNLIVIADPEVYKGPVDNYLIIGEAKIEKLVQPQDQKAGEESKMVNDLQQSIKKIQRMIKAGVSDENEGTGESDESQSSSDSEEDSSDLDEADIKIVMEQGHCSRNQAIEALKKNKDVIEAILGIAGL